MLIIIAFKSYVRIFSDCLLNTTHFCSAPSNVQNIKSQRWELQFPTWYLVFGMLCDLFEDDIITYQLMISWTNQKPKHPPIQSSLPPPTPHIPRTDRHAGDKLTSYPNYRTVYSVLCGSRDFLQTSRGPMATVGTPS